MNDAVATPNPYQASVAKEEKLDYHIKCPAGMKMPKAIKSSASQMHYWTKEQRRYYMRAMGLAYHEAAQRRRSKQEFKIADDSAE